MDHWHAFLDHETLTCVAGLESIGFQFTWREEVTPGADGGQGALWFEIWRHGRLLNIAGAFSQPISLDELWGVKHLILQQGRLLMMTQQH